MMRRRASPSARTTRTAPTGPASRSPATALLCLARSRRSRGQSPGTAPARAWKVDRSVAEGRRADPGTTPRPDARPDRPLAGDRRSGCCSPSPPWPSTASPSVDRYYDHFVWQAAAFLEGQVAIRYPVEAPAACWATRLFQDVLPDRDDRRRGPRRSCPSRRCRRSSSCRSSRCGASRPMTRRSSRSSPRSTSRSAGGCSAACRSASVVRLGDDGLLRLRDGLLVHRPVWRRRGTRPTSSRSGWRSWPIGIAVGATRSPPRTRPTTATPSMTADAPPEDAGRRRARRRAALARRSAPVPGRPAVRPGLHRAPDGRVRGPVLRARRPGRTGGGGAGRPGSVRRSRSLAAGALQRRDDRPRLPSRLRVPVPPRGDGYPSLGYHPEWAVEDPRYLPQNLGIVLLARRTSCPSVLPDSARHADRRYAPTGAIAACSTGCPLAVPRDTGMSVLLTSPAYLLAIPALRRIRAQPARHGSGPRDRRHRRGEPDALQPGLGPVRLPVQQRRRRRSRSSSWRSA